MKGKPHPQRIPLPMDIEILPFFLFLLGLGLPVAVLVYAAIDTAREPDVRPGDAE